MACANDKNNSLRLGRRESNRLVVALLLSLVVHLTVWLTYHEGEKHGWWQKWHVPTWLQPAQSKQLARLAQQIAENQANPQIFVDVSHADADAPKQTKYYSSKNSRAANQDTANTTAPKINGAQTYMPKTEDAARPTKAATPETPKPAEKTPPAEETPPAKETPKDAAKPDNAPKYSSLQPSMPAPTPPDDRPEGPQTPGETDRPRPKPATPTPTPATTAATPPVRPRTLKQALAQRDQLPGQQMKQEGGVPRHNMTSSLDVKATPFGEYDRAIIEAVSQRWYDLLDQKRFAQDRNGRVTLRFKLKSDGSVIEMRTLDNTVGELLGYLCQESVEEAAPFAKWPPDMVRMIGANYREVTFTFYYY